MSNLTPDQEWAAIRAQTARPSLAAAVGQGVAMFGVNAWLFASAWRGETSAVAIALYGAFELLLWSVLTNAALAGVPKDQRVGSPDVPVAQRAVVMLVGAVVLIGLALAGASGDHAHLQALRDAANPLGLLVGMGIGWPLLTSAATAAWACVEDRRRWRRQGGPYVTTLAKSAVPKLFTALVAPPVALFASDMAWREHRPSALLLWAAVYLGLKSVFELGFLYWLYLGMPDKPGEAVARGKAKRR